MDESMSSVKVHHGQNVRFSREFVSEVPLTQEELGEKMGISQKEISQIEKKEILPDEVLYQISEILDVPFKFLKNSPLKENLKKWIYNHNQPVNNNTFNDSAKESNFAGNIEGEWAAGEINYIESEAALKLAEQLGNIKTEMKYLRAENNKLKKENNQLKSKK